MLNAERRTQILEALGRDKRVLATELASHFGVSEDTVRHHIAPHLPTFRAGKVRVVTVAALEAYLAEHSDRVFDGVTR